MPFLKGKPLSQKTQEQQEKLRQKRIKLAEMETDVQIQGIKQKQHSAEIARLKA